MLCLIDASSWILAWSHYPIQDFAKVWEWISEEIKIDNIQTIEVIHREVANRSEGCSKWLYDNGVTYPDVSGKHLLDRGVEIKRNCNITQNIKNNSHGINDNDLELIAIASLTNRKVITEESPDQGNGTPPQPMNYKIPLVCRLNNVEVANFEEMMTASGKTLG